MKFADFASVCSRIKSRSSKNEKVSTLAQYLKTLDDESLKIATMFLSGQTFPRGSGLDLNVGYSAIWDTLVELSDFSPSRLRKMYTKHGDLGDMAEEALARTRVQPLFKTELTLVYVYEQFKKMASAIGHGSVEGKKKIMIGLLVNCSPLEAKYLIKTMLSELRIGLVGGLVELSLAEAFGRDIDDVREAALVGGDISYVAMLAKENRLSSAVMRPFTPVNFMLADVMTSAKEIVEYYKKPLISEYKYDGIRAQVHKVNGKVRIFSRRLEDITSGFPDIVDPFLKLPSDIILDGELVPIRNGKPLPFHDLQRRLRRKNVDEDVINEIPVFYMAYDILYENGSTAIKDELTKRKQKLSNVPMVEPLVNAPYKLLQHENEISGMFIESRNSGHEGLILKDPATTYKPGRRGRHWVKLKEELDTIDAVIVIAEYGHGKRAGVLSDYTFAVRSNSELKVIGKAYSGLTDEEIEQMTARLKSIMIEDQGYRIIVKPEIVLEIAFDSIQKSERHESGYALRFPRIKRIRDDKGVDDIDSLEKVKQIYANRFM